MLMNDPDEEVINMLMNAPEEELQAIRMLISKHTDNKAHVSERQSQWRQNLKASAKMGDKNAKANIATTKDKNAKQHGQWRQDLKASAKMGDENAQGTKIDYFKFVT